MRRRLLALAALLLLLAVAGSGQAPNHLSLVPEADDHPGPHPGPDALGVDENDVRDEAGHPQDDNGFPGAEDGDYWSPKEDPLILEAFVAPGTGFFRPDTSVDVDNLLNLALHGSNHKDHEKTMYPGLNRFGAWWGWWSDTGGGGDMQEHAATADAPGVGDPNGAIDDADDCRDAQWDEFTWRGDHPCPDETEHPAYPDDQMFAFIQPGTHNWHINLLYASLLSSDADEPTEPDFEYADDGQRWREARRPLDLEYDSSLLVTTSVVTAVNPKEVSTGSDTAFDPSTPSDGLDDPDRDHAVDFDVYTTPDPVVEQAYRAAVWDPGDQVDSPTDALHPDGPKGWAKDNMLGVDEAQQEANEVVGTFLAPSERQRGVADDLAQGPFFHEPNTPGDVYGYDADGVEREWAAHDPATSYGGLDGDYYEPGPDQAYPGYQSGERFWFDAQITITYLPSPLVFGFQAQATPEVPSPTSPAGSTAREDDDNTQAPGMMYFDGFHGTWYDADGDTWVGEAGEDGHPYDNGTTDDPNDYVSEFSETTDEFRPTCGTDIDMTLHPTSDTDGDGTNDWGAAGVYVMGPESHTYGSPWMDAVGHAADPALDPLREDETVGSEATLLFPDRDRMENHRTEGPVEVTNWVCADEGADIKWSHAEFFLLLPTGSLDFTFEAVTHAELTDPGRTSQHGDNEDRSLTGQSVTDVDRFDAILDPLP